MPRAITPRTTTKPTAMPRRRAAERGAGAEAAGLSGVVDADTFKAVLEGVMPDGDVILPAATASIARAWT